MKKKLIGLALLVLMVFPFQTHAAEKAMNLEETLKSVSIDADLKNYKESDNQTTIYLFMGETCGYCHKFLEYLASIIPEYGTYFKLQAYEIWNNADNSKLMKKVANFLDESVGGVPFIVIGDKTFVGYTENYNDQIKSAIKEQYDSKDKYDVMNEMKKEEKKTSSGSSATTIIWNFVFITIGTGVILAFVNAKHQETQRKIEELLNKTQKEKTKEENKNTNTKSKNNKKK